MIDELIDRAAFRRRLTRLRPIRAYRARALAARQLAFRPVPDLGDLARSVAAGVSGTGVHVIADAAELGVDVTVPDLIALGATAWRWNARHLLESDAVLSQYPAAYHLGLKARLLDMAEAYLGEPCYYIGCALKLERVSASVAGTRQWHCDVEDDRMLRMILYLNDVGPGGGPFQFIPAPRSVAAKERLGYRSGYVSDERMRAAVPEAAWQEVLGPAGAVVAIDGTRVFHRVSRPTAAERFSLTLSYSSRHPLQIFRHVRLRTASRNILMRTLSERQQACIPAARWS